MRFQKRFKKIVQSETRIACGGYQTWPPKAILISDWPIFKNLLL
jgi:hypothetical protein